MSTLRVDNIKSRTGSVLTVPESNTLAVTGIVSVTSSGSLQVAGNETIGGNQTVSGNQTITGNQLISGITTVSGVARFTGDVSIGGTLTYEDVTNVDSVGLITARNGINMSGGTATLAGTFNANGDVNLGNASSDTITATGRFDSDLIPSTGNTRDLGTNSFQWKDLYLDGTANIDSLVADTADINGGTVDGATVGANSASSGAFTTLSASGNVDLGDATSDSITATGRFDSHIIPLTDGTYDLGSSSVQWQDLYIDGTANIDSLVSDTARVADLTDGRVVYAGSGGELQDSSNLTFNGSTLSATTFSGSGASLTNINASNISSGTISASRVPTLNQNTTGNASTATVAGAITVVDESTDTTCYPLFADGATGNLSARSGTNLTFNSANGTLTATIFAGRLENVPASNKTSSYTTVKADAGTMIRTNSNVTIGASIYTAGDIISIYNNSGSDITIQQSSTTLRKVGTSDTGNITLAQRGLMTVTCVSSNEFVCSGGGMS